jgi:iron-sulfur cluster repair protein YtfE (RIC family)
MSCEQTISGDLTVNEVIRLYPATAATFAAFGIDSCCGGGLAVSEAARRHQIETDTLLAALAATPCGCAARA